MGDTEHDRAILEKLTDLAARLGSVSIDVSGVKAGMTTMASNVNDLKIDVAVVKDRTGTTQTRIESIDSRVHTNEASIQRLDTGSAIAGKGVLWALGIFGGVIVLVVGIILGRVFMPAPAAPAVPPATRAAPAP